jgi:energy-coupling factor transporter ATP-binding protein EcfA2
MITIESLRFRNLVIDALTIQPGITTITGPNGSGKTSFLKICAGITVPDSGTISIDDLPPRKTEIGWVNEFPDQNILFARVIDEIASPLRFRRAESCSAIENEVRSCAESVGISPLLTRAVRELSGGEKVLVALASALVQRPKVLVLDEYDSHLDASMAATIDRAIRASGTRYVVRCTQQMDTALESDHLLFFDSGRVAHAGSPEEVFSSLKGTAYYPVLWGCGL